MSDNGHGSNSSLRSEKETTRATLFVTHDFEKDAKNVFTKIMGKHTLTGMFAVDEDVRDNRSWIRYTADDNFADWIRRQYNENRPRKITDDYVLPNSVIYLGESLLGKTIEGANLPGPSVAQTPASGLLHTFDGTWKWPQNPSDPNYVDPTATWINHYYTDSSFSNYTMQQNSNPANYVGWTTMQLNWIDSEASPENRMHNYTSARLTKSRVASSAFVWQGKFWNNAIVGTWGVRQDIAKSWTKSTDTNQAYWANTAKRGVLDLSPEAYYLNDQADVRRQVTSHSWMIVGHINDLPGLDKVLEKSPVNVSLFYNKSSNFQPAANRIDIYGAPLPAPVGNTTDKGILLETKDGKYSLKINKYETISLNATNTQQH